MIALKFRMIWCAETLTDLCFGKSQSWECLYCSTTKIINELFAMSPTFLNCCVSIHQSDNYARIIIADCLQPVSKPNLPTPTSVVQHQPAVWNNLPAHITNDLTISATDFKRKLKTHLYACSFNSSALWLFPRLRFVTHCYRHKAR